MGQSSRAARRRTTAALTAAIAAVAAGAAAPAASAEPWGYDYVSPPGTAAATLQTMQVAAGGNAALVSTNQVPLDGKAGDSRPGPYFYALRGPGFGSILDVPLLSPEIAFNLLSVTASHLTPDGSRAVLRAAVNLDQAPGKDSGWWIWDAATGLTRVADDSLQIQAASLVTSADLSALAYTRQGGGGGVWRWAGGATTQVSVDDDGNPLGGNLGDAGNISGGPLTQNAMSADGSSVLFTSRGSADGDNDGALSDVYRRDVAAGTTTLVSDDTPGPDPDTGGAAFRWASPDHARVMWRGTTQFDGDTDNANDLFYRDGSGPIVSITKGEDVGGSPTGNADAPTGTVEWVATSDDGNRVYFITQEQLTGDAPAAGDKLYERDIAAGATRFVAGPLAAADTAGGSSGDQGVGSLLTTYVDDHSKRGIRIVSGGVAFESMAPLAGDADGHRDVFLWTRDGGLRLVSHGTPDTDAFLVARGTNDYTPQTGGRGVAVGGAQVFVTTAATLAAEDTDGGALDVYAWTAAGGGFELVSPAGDDPADAHYMNSSPDGTRVFVETGEAILPGDQDGGDFDLYLALHGGGSPPSDPVPPVPPGPTGPAGPLPQVPPTPTPPSETPKPVVPAPVTPPPLPPAPPDQGGGDDHTGERATLEARVGKRVTERGARIVVRASAAGELRIRGIARLRHHGRLRKTRVARANEEIEARDRTRFRVELRKAATKRLERRGRLRVRFVLRLRPSGDERAARERVTVTLRTRGRR